MTYIFTSNMHTNMSIIIGLFFVNFVLNSAELIVNTKNGKIRGRLVPINSTSSIEMYTGIPFAEPPIGNLRFARPLPKQSWAPGILNAVHYGPACPQLLWFLRRYSFPDNFNNTNEDCLYLNLFVPENDHTSRRFPVLVWVHGGAYRYGSGSEYDGRLLASQGIIVVTINYRIGVLGFLSTDDSAAPGNYGLLDQKLAFEWVKHNIGAFGGNSDEVTIAGQSAGGGSVSLHMFSPLSRGLFRGIIPQSGCALSPWAIYRSPYTVMNATLQLAKHLNCSAVSSTSIVRCLRNKPANLLVETPVVAPPMISAWAPRVDGYFLTDLPEHLLEKENYINNVSIMTGTVPNESSDEIGNVPGVETGFNESTLLQQMKLFSSRFGPKQDLILKALQCQYSTNKSSIITNRDLFIELKSDYGYIIPHIQLVNRLTRKHFKTYFYSFDYRSPFLAEPKWMGILHATELDFEFGAPILSDFCKVECVSKWPTRQNWTLLDKQMSQSTMTIWSNFVKYLNPNPLSDKSQYWPEYDVINGTLYVISPSPALKHRYKRGRYEFWNQYIPSLLNGTDTGMCQYNHNPDTIFGK